MFHVFYLRKWLGDKVDLFPLEEIHIDENKRLIMEPKAIMAKETKKLGRKMINLVLMKWKHASRLNLT